MKETQDNWGGWKLNPQCAVLIRDDHEYEVDLKHCTSASQVLERLTQVAGTPVDLDVAGLTRAINDVLRPEGYLVSSGKSKELSKKEIWDLVDAAAHQWPERVVATTSRDV